MARNSELIQKRNKDIEQSFAELTKKYPHWKIEYVIQRIAEKYYLKPSTVEAIITKK